MKRIIPFFAVCLGLSVFQTGVVIGAESTRNNVKRDSGNLITTNAGTSRANTTNKQKTEQNRPDNARTTTVKKRQSQNILQSRNTVINRPQTKTRGTTPENTSKNNTITRTTISGDVAVARNATKRSAVSRVSTSGKTPSRISRAGELDAEKITSIKSRDYLKCKSIYYECMDEFCANKDANLRRCACSSRIHEFDTIKQQLTDAEDKMLDFNQRLLVVGLDKEDAATINIASEGEIGFDTRDTSESEKLLKKITNSLNSSGDSKINNSLSAISLSLNADSAWDSIDSMSGVTTTSKSGVDLYNAATPICIAMAREVCSDQELDVAQSSYKLTIQQDCNTVAKAYNTQYNQAIEKIHESSALLDMARLNAYQQRNSDDILTCKKKILDQLSDTAVCGTNLYKCLDVTGQYIDPSTGNAFLSNNLYNITSLLTEPSGSDTWSKMPQNGKFVTFLNSKKIFLESATDQCQESADTVWQDFLNDALGQIKLAQNAKLEEIRQSCTTLVAECKNDALKSLEDFDARALSTFEVMSDVTVNAICANVENSCTSLLNSSGGGGEMWASGISGVTADISYQAIIKNCSTVGKDCIIQHCNGTAGNFALCGTYSDASRRAILKRQACWPEVLNCVKQATNLDSMNIQSRQDFYLQVYNTSDISSLPVLCETSLQSSDQIACLIAEQIWGNCDNDAGGTAITTNATLIDNAGAFDQYTTAVKSQNKILIPTYEENTSLLAWLASNTGTTEDIDSCSAYYCPINYKYDTITKTCKRMVGDASPVTTDGETYITTDQTISITDSITNYCPGGRAHKDMYGNCCASGAVSNGICVPSSEYYAIELQTASCDNTGISLPDDPAYYCPNASYSDGAYHLSGNNPWVYSVYCIKNTDTAITQSTTDASLTCRSNGNSASYIILVNQHGDYIVPKADTAMQGPTISYKPNPNDVCIYQYSLADTTWKWMNGSTECSQNIIPLNDTKLMVTYPVN